MGARLHAAAQCFVFFEFQSTRPAWGRDRQPHGTATERHDFNPRAPHGGATGLDGLLTRADAISIHAPRMGARRELRVSYSPCSYFNPRAPHGGATEADMERRDWQLFQSTRPAWGRDLDATRIKQMVR